MLKNDDIFFRALRVAVDEHPEMEGIERFKFANALACKWKGIPTDAMFNVETQRPIVEKGRVKYASY